MRPRRSVAQVFQPRSFVNASANRLSIRQRRSKLYSLTSSIASQKVFPAAIDWNAVDSWSFPILKTLSSIHSTEYCWKQKMAGGTPLTWSCPSRT